MRTVRTVFLGVALSLATGAAAQTVDLPSMAGGPGDTVSATISFTAGAQDIASWSIDVGYDRDSLGQVTFPECPVAAGAASPGTIQCSQEASGQTDVFRVGMFTVPSATIGSGDVAIVEFTIPPDATLGTSFDLVLDEAVFFDPAGNKVGGAATVNVGSIDVACPDGESCFSSDPVVGGALDLGAAVVGNEATPNTFLTVFNSSPDTTFDVTDFDGPGLLAFANTAGGITVPTNGSVAFDGADEDAVRCTPALRGANAGSFTLSHDADNGPNPASYDFTCDGLSPNVEVSPIEVTINGSTADATAPTGSFDITNVQDGFSSDATNASLAESGTAEISITDDLTDATIAVGETDTVVLACDNSVADTFSETITLTYDDPLAAGSIEVLVNCNISDVSPGYSSIPAVPGPLDFGSVENGQSATLSIDIGNEDSIGEGAGAELEITGVTLSDTTNYSFDPDPFTATLAAGAANGTESLDVTCNPQSIGDFSGETITVETNDGDQVYDLLCEGTSNAELVVAPAGARDGTLNLGTVAPGSTTSAQLTLSNAGTDPLEVDCDLTNDNGGVIVFDPVPAFPVTLPPNASLTFSGTPPDNGSYSELLECFASEPATAPARGVGDNPTFTTTVTVSGRPLVIPTMSPWGLALMSLMLLLVAGFAGRRMMV